MILPICYCVEHDGAHVHLPVLRDAQFGLAVYADPEPEPAPESEERCANCGHAEVHHNSPIANGRCEGEWERCGCGKWRPRTTEDR